MNPPNPKPPGVATSASPVAPMAAWQAHLERELTEVTTQNHHPRSGDFDMDDEPEFPLLEAWPRLREALAYQRETLLPRWRAADQSANRNQAWHRLLARITIIAGTSAIVLAVLQMAIISQAPAWSGLALAMELLAVAAGAVAVVVGLRTKGHRKWLADRNRAERLRILKFDSLGWKSLWAADLAEWKRHLDERAGRLAEPLSLEQVRQWVGNEPTHILETGAAPAVPDDASLAAVQEYYRLKRLAFQAAYFANRQARHQKAAGPWRHLSGPVFLTSTGFVLIHFAAGWLYHRAEVAGALARESFWHGIEIWTLALAAMIPVAGLGCRVWLGAFEPHRSANLFGCKLRAVGDILKRLSTAEPTSGAWRLTVAEAEQFFRNEHREWLRLMLETEWML